MTTRWIVFVQRIKVCPLQFVEASLSASSTHFLLPKWTKRVWFGSKDIELICIWQILALDPEMFPKAVAFFTAFFDSYFLIKHWQLRCKLPPALFCFWISNWKNNHIRKALHQYKQFENFFVENDITLSFCWNAL